MKRFLMQSGATVVLGTLLITHALSGQAQAEHDPWAILHPSDTPSWTASEGATSVAAEEAAYYPSGMPCSTISGLQMLDCRLEYVTSTGFMAAWKTQWPSDTGYRVGGTSIATQVTTRLDREAGKLVRDHRVAVESFAFEEGKAYPVSIEGTAPNGHNGFNDSGTLTFRPRPSGAFAPSAEIIEQLSAAQRGTTTVTVAVDGEYRDVSLFYALEAPNGSPVTSYKAIATKGAAGNRVAFVWDTTTVANGRYTVVAAAQNAQGYSLGWSVKKGIVVDNPTNACLGAGPCGISVANAADGRATFAPGSIVMISAANLPNVWQSASGTPLPRSLGGVQVWFEIDGVRTAGYLYSVSPYLLTAQIPLDSMRSNMSLGSPRSSVTAKVFVSSAQGISQGHDITIKPFAPAFFTSAGIHGGIPAMLHASESVPGTVVPVSDVTGTEWAHAGEIVMLYATGLGLPTVTIPPRPYAFAGEAAPGKPFFALLQSDNNPQARIIISNGTVRKELASNQLRFGFKAPFTTGVDQVNFVIPSDLEDGTYDITLCFASECSSVGKLPVTKRPTRYPETVRINSYANGSSVDQSLVPSGGEVETADETILPDPVPVPPYDPTPLPTEDCWNSSWDAGCVPPVEVQTEAVLNSSGPSDAWNDEWQWW